MAKIEGRPGVTMNVTIVLSESEAAALDAIVGYGDDAFLEVFYNHMGKSYLKPHEEGLRSLFRSVRTGDCSVQSFLQLAKDARAVLNGAKKAINL